MELRVLEGPLMFVDAVIESLAPECLCLCKTIRNGLEIRSRRCGNPKLGTTGTDESPMSIDEVNSQVPATTLAHVGCDDGGAIGRIKLEGKRCSLPKKWH